MKDLASVAYNYVCKYDVFNDMTRHVVIVGRAAIPQETKAPALFVCASCVQAMFHHHDNHVYAQFEKECKHDCSTGPQTNQILLLIICNCLEWFKLDPHQFVHHHHRKFDMSNWNHMVCK